MAAPFVPKPPRGRIPISDADRAAARAGMDGEKTKQPSEEAPPAQTQPVAIEPVAAPTQPAAPVADVPVAPVVEPTPPAAPVPVVAAAAAERSTPAPTADLAAVVATATTHQSKPSAQPVTVASGRRGRKPAMTTVSVEPPPVRSVKIRETVWGDIKLILAQLPKEENTPRNIQAYVEAAHQHYEAHLRKQGKLPSK